MLKDYPSNPKVTKLIFGSTNGTNSMYSGGGVALFVEICMLKFDFFAIFVLCFVSTSVLRNCIMRNRAQVSPFITTVIYYKYTVQTEFHYYFDSE